MAKTKRDSGRIEGRFVALPFTVLESPAYLALSHTARSLLLELALQFNGNNNGRLLASLACLSKRGWKSPDVISRAKHALIEAGFIYQTVQGHRPNKASWYALTWHTLDRLPGFDPGAVELFRRGAFRSTPLLTLVPAKPSKEELYERWRTPGKIATLITSDVAAKHLIATSDISVRCFAAT